MDVKAALRRAMDSERARLAEDLIRREAIHFMRQQTVASSSHQADMQMVLTVQPSEPKDVPPRSQSSALPPEFASTDDYLAHLSQKYGLKRMPRPRIVIATPVLNPSALTPASSATPATPAAPSTRGRFKRTARKRVAPPPRALSSGDSEEESIAAPDEIVIETVPQPQEASKTRIPTMTEQAQKDDEAIPPEVEVKLEIEEMTPEEFDYFGTNNLTFHQAQELDAMRANAQAAKRKGKVKADLSHDPELSAWAFKVKNIHLSSGTTIPLGDSSSGQPIGMNEAADLKRAIKESLEFERLRKEKAEREHLEILAQIREAELKEMWDKVDEEHEQNRRERNKRHKL